MNPLKLLGEILQKPQSLLMGGMAAIDPLYEDVTRKRLRESTGKDMSRSEVLKQGLTGSIAPSDFWSQGARTSLPGKVSAPLVNATMDPLMLAGAVTKPLTAGTKVGKLAEAANTFGKLGEGATKGERAAQVARRFIQGSLAGGGDATYGLGYAALGGSAERVLQNAFARAASKMGTKAAEQLVSDGVEKAVSTPAVTKLMSNEEAMRLAAMPHINPTDEAYAAGMREAAATSDSALDTVKGLKGFEPSQYPVEKWQPTGQTPVDSDPVVRMAREYFKYNPDATTTDAVFDLGLFDGNIPQIKQARVPFNTERVPYSDRGAVFNDQLMQNGFQKPSMEVVPPTIQGIDRMPQELMFPPMDIKNPVFSPNGPPKELGPAPTPRPMAATTGKAVEPFVGELPPMQPYDVPMGSGTWDMPQRQPKALNAAPNATPVGPVGPSSVPYAAPPRGTPPSVDPAKLLRLAREFRSTQNMQALPPGAPQQEDQLMQLLLKAALGG